MTDPRIKPPTITRELGKRRGKPTTPVCIRLTPVLLEWVEKAAYREGMTISAFLRVAARDRADRILGYNRDNRHTRLPDRDPRLDDRMRQD